MKKLTVLLSLLLILAAVPLIAFFGSSSVKKTSSEGISENNVKTEITENFSTEPAIMYAAFYYSDALEPEAVKALCLICQNNCSADKDFLMDSKNFLNESSMKEKWKQSYSENLNKLKTAFNSVKNMKITYNGKEVFVPLFYASDGKTATSDEYPFLQSIASPWDKISTEYSKNSKSLGVSVNGVNHIIKQGVDFTTALLWYLPDFEIKQ